VAGLRVKDRPCGVLRLVVGAGPSAAGAGAADPGARRHKAAFEGAFLGALLIDPPAPAMLPDERVFVITRWASPRETGSMMNWRLFINGLSWPHTERLEYALGDTVHWRVINASLVDHPMHLHGFYFDVIARGDTQADTLFVDGTQPRAVTHTMPELASLRLRWEADEPGNWLFHCHLIRHMSPQQRFVADGVLHDMMHDHDMEHMAGLVLGITVRPPDGWIANKDAPVRRIDLWTGARASVFGENPALAFVVQHGATAPAPDSIDVPSTTLVLRRDEPTRIVVHNRFDFPLSVHWHGLELRSRYDGVGHWSGHPGATSPPVPPGDTMVVHITPRRAGSFMYHIHGETAHESDAGTLWSVPRAGAGRGVGPRAGPRVRAVVTRCVDRATAGDQRPRCAPGRTLPGRPHLPVAPPAHQRERPQAGSAAERRRAGDVAASRKGWSGRRCRAAQRGRGNHVAGCRRDGGLRVDAGRAGRVRARSDHALLPCAATRTRGAACEVQRRRRGPLTSARVQPASVTTAL
jgi:FtsP/CotA-like multicopper oxidase with cupredoxin domain